MILSQQKPNKAVRHIVPLTLLFSVFFPRRVWAYLDPGTGSYVFQVLLAIAVGCIYTLKLYWKKIKALVTTFFKKD